MDGRILEVERPGRYIRLYRGFCIIEEKGTEIARLALADLECVIFHSHDGVISQQLLAELAERGIPLVVCDSRHMPVGIYWSLYKHHLTTGRVAAQASLSLPKRKQLWQQLVQSKIINQAKILDAKGVSSADLKRLAKRVRSGDPDNYEAQAAQAYWPRLFHPEFRRDPDQEDWNVFLNYGYAILRASVVRAIVGCGLHPALALHHRNAEDPTPLANDFMEPWRPLVDLAVLHLREIGASTLDSLAKAKLVEVINWDMDSTQGRSPLRMCLERMCLSFVDICKGESGLLDLAEMPPIDDLHNSLRSACDH